MKIYVVTTGQYSDYTIRGIYSKKEAAQHAHDVWETFDHWSGANDIEEYELDTPMEKQYYFIIHYSPNDNRISYSFYNDMDQISFPTEPTYTHNYFTFWLPYSARIDNVEILKKIAQDKWAEYKARIEEL